MEHQSGNYAIIMIARDITTKTNIRLKIKDCRKPYEGLDGEKV
ncbi:MULTISPECIES: hypothetical protein [Pontibacter]|nr:MULTISPECIES: hypothetical protein [Pontibacter]